MRIGIDARLYNETGVGRYLRNLIRELAKIDRENEYTLFVGKKEFENLVLPSGKWKKVLADFRWHTLREQLIMPVLLLKEKLDLIHFPYFNVPIFYRGRFIVTIHDLIISHFHTGRSSTLPGWLYRIKRLGYKISFFWAIKFSRKIITVSKTTKQEIVDHFKIDEKKIVVTYEGAEELKEAKEEKTDIPENNYLLYVGNAYPHKNLNRLIEAFSCFPEAKLIMAGREDFFYQKLKEKFKKEENILFLGEISDGRLISLYRKAKALIIPSLMEGFGLPAVEALFYGCPVLASRIPVFLEILGEAAYYFDPNDPNDIKKAVKEILLNQSLRETLKERGFRQAKKYSGKRMAQETFKIYYASCFGL